jgi:aspartate aminotransferase-like enzyme
LRARSIDMATDNFSPLTLTPGPVHPPQWVFEALNQRPLHQRSKAFLDFFDQLLDDLRYVLQTEAEVVVFPGSGTYGTEMAMRSAFRPGQTVVIQVNGKFSERWARYGQELGLEVHIWEAARGQTLNPSDLGKICEGIEPAGFVFTHMETSTGALLDLEEISWEIRQRFPTALLVVDAVSTVGTIPLYMDDWDLDIVVTASQKGLLNPVGVAIAGISQRAKEKLAVDRMDDALHLGTYLKALNTLGYPFTPPVQLLFGLGRVAAWLREQGLAQVWMRTHRAAWKFREGLTSMGFELFTAPNCLCDASTAFFLPEADPSTMREAWFTQYALEVAGGQGEMVNQLVRMGHFSQDPEADVEEALRRISIWKQTLQPGT